MASMCFVYSISYNFVANIFIAFSLFPNWFLSVWQTTTNPVGKWVNITLVSTLFEDKESTLVIIKDISLQHQLSREMLRAEIAEETNRKLATEIKERIRTEKLLQEQFLRSNAIFDSSSNTLLLTLDTDFKISSFNTHRQNYFSNLIDKKMELNDSFNYFFN